MSLWILGRVEVPGISNGVNEYKPIIYVIELDNWIDPVDRILVGAQRSAINLEFAEKREALDRPESRDCLY